MEILTKKKGTLGETAGIKDFGTMLKHYGSNPNYAPELCANYNEVVGDMTTILNKAIQTKYDCLAEVRKKLSDAWDEFNKAHGQHADAHAAKDPERIKRAQEDIRRVEKLVKQREDEVRWIEEAIEKLEARRTGLTKEADCPPLKKAAAPPPTP
jgi:DNA repair exonuclease SbcCD ATPase subunit